MQLVAAGLHPLRRRRCRGRRAPRRGRRAVRLAPAGGRGGGARAAIRRRPVHRVSHNAAGRRAHRRWARAVAAAAAAAAQHAVERRHASVGRCHARRHGGGGGVHWRGPAALIRLDVDPGDGARWPTATGSLRGRRGLTGAAFGSAGGRQARGAGVRASGYGARGVVASLLVWRAGAHGRGASSRRGSGGGGGDGGGGASIGGGVGGQLGRGEGADIGFAPGAAGEDVAEQPVERPLLGEEGTVGVPVCHGEGSPPAAALRGFLVHLAHGAHRIGRQRARGGLRAHALLHGRRAAREAREALSLLLVLVALVLAAVVRLDGDEREELREHLRFDLEVERRVRRERRRQVHLARRRPEG
eukprot:scaffold345_cov68-Phaeocystis_antarctica.AAC.4